MLGQRTTTEALHFKSAGSFLKFTSSAGVKHDACRDPDGNGIRTFQRTQTFQDHTGGGSGEAFQPFRRDVLELLRTRAVSRDIVGIERPLQQRDQIRRRSLQSDRPAQQDWPGGFGIQKPAGDRSKTFGRHLLDESVRNPAMLSQPRVDRPCLKESLDDLPAVQRDDLARLQPHQDVLPHLQVFQRRDEHFGDIVIVPLSQSDPHGQRRIALINRELLAAVLIVLLAGPPFRSADGDCAGVRNLASHGSDLRLDLAESGGGRSHAYLPPSTIVQLILSLICRCSEVFDVSWSRSSVAVFRSRSDAESCSTTRAPCRGSG